MLKSLVPWQSSLCPFSKTWLLTKELKVKKKKKKVWNALDIWALELRNMVPYYRCELGDYNPGVSGFFFFNALFQFHYSELLY